ncbi:hypothetical protein ACFLVH_05050, partial [Chloroflexota bacterium]
AGWRSSFKECTLEQLLWMVKARPRAFKIWEKLGIEIPEDMVPIIDVAFSARHTPNSGGVKVNRDYQSSLPGLFAAGETRYMEGGGVNGAMVDGAIAGTNAAEYARKKKTTHSTIPEQLEKLKKTLYRPAGVKRGLRPSAVRRKLIEAVNGVILEKGFLMNEESLKRSVDILEKLKREDLPRVMSKDSHELMTATELRSLLTVLPPMFKTSVMRQESRVMAREDYPYRDDENWLKWINLRLKEDGELELWTEDTPSRQIASKGDK